MPLHNFLLMNIYTILKYHKKAFTQLFQNISYFELLVNQFRYCHSNITVNLLKFDLGWKLSTDKNIPPIWKKIMKFGTQEKNHLYGTRFVRNHSIMISCSLVLRNHSIMVSYSLVLRNHSIMISCSLVLRNHSIMISCSHVVWF